MIDRRPRPGHVRSLLTEAIAAAIEAVDPEVVVERSLRRRGDVLEFASERFPVDGRRVVVIAVGKAAPGMARAAGRLLEGAEVDGVVVAQEEAPVPGRLELVVGGHPSPDEGSLAAGRAVLDAASSAGPGCLILMLVSGGASALMELPAGRLDLDDLVVTGGALMRAGAPIEELNAVRKHLSMVKGGRVGAAVAGATSWTLALSDVVGDRLDVIGSGPTVGDPTTYRDALDVLDRRGLLASVPAPVRVHLTAGAAGRHAETPDGLPGVARVIGSGSTAAAAAAAALEDLGIAATVVSTTLAGEARDQAVECLDRVAGLGVPGAFLWAGETTVTVTGDGTGGRNQEAALAAALHIDRTEDTVFAAVGTDGRDGPTDAAGAIVDGATAGLIRSAGFDPAAYLDRNDSAAALEASGARLVIGSTGTNVGDLWIVCRS